MEYQTAEESFAELGAGPEHETRHESPDRCICGRLVTVTVRMRRRSIGVCDRCWDMRIEALKRGSRRAD